MYTVVEDIPHTSISTMNYPHIKLQYKHTRTYMACTYRNDRNMCIYTETFIHMYVHTYFSKILQTCL